jgi:hypothetical protein
MAVRVPRRCSDCHNHHGRVLREDRADKNRRTAADHLAPAQRDQARSFRPSQIKKTPQTERLFDLIAQVI